LHAVGHFLELPADYLRAIITDELLHHIDEYSMHIMAVHGDWNQLEPIRVIHRFIDENSTSCTWNDDITMSALMNGLRRTGVVQNLVIRIMDYSIPGDFHWTIIGDPDAHAKSLVIHLHYTGDHYDSLIPK
jgi:hypothetical protein